MKRGLYLKLALDGMRKNGKLYLPYLLTCAGMVMMFYIVYSLACSRVMETMRGGGTMRVVLLLGTIVISVFALLFLFYTNAFLIRRRNREFGLYNILGMNKGNISRILFWETLLSAAFALLVGLVGGLLFAKLAELFLLRMAGETPDYAFHVEPKGILAAFLFFGLIFALLLLVSFARVRLRKPLDLLKSESAGEKPPKANWLFAAMGVVLLGAAYYLAVRIDAPLTALLWFFFAVLMVIVATYLLFIAGSVALCKLLQKNKGYYYKAAHFVSVSSMAFRMKRNGAGLASICILATMVLVMLSSTSCLYFGGENAMREAYPYEASAAISTVEPEDCSEENRLKMESLAREAAGAVEIEPVSCVIMELDGYFADGVLDINGVERNIDEYSSAFAMENVRSVYILPLSDYNRLAGAARTLEPGEALLWSSGEKYRADTFTLKGCGTIHIQERLESLPFRTAREEVVAAAYYLFVPDWMDYAASVKAYAESLGSELISVPTKLSCGFDLPGVAEEEQIRIEDRYLDLLSTRNYGLEYVFCSGASRAGARSDFFSSFGSLFFLGVVLSVVFLAAAALIIYYKQLSEGYEDQSRFGIMQKVGMTKKEIRGAVNSQVRTVFFAPLLLAGLHFAFAFPFIQKILRLFRVTNTPLLICTCVLSYLAFALFYVFVYRKTAKTYYGIVSSAELRQ